MALRHDDSTINIVVAIIIIIIIIIMFMLHTMLYKPVNLAHFTIHSSHQIFHSMAIICFVISRNIYVEDHFLLILNCCHFLRSCSVDMTKNSTQVDFSHYQNIGKHIELLGNYTKQ